MRLVILEDYDLASEWAAKYIRNRIIQFKPRYFTLGLLTGSTPFGFYKKLIEPPPGPPGNVTDLEAECEAFEKKIAQAGGIDLFVGGIGPDGHIAFNEPGSSLVYRTRVKTLSKVPTMALTVGVGTVMDARTLLHYAFALYKAIEEGVNRMWTVSAFQQHLHTIFVCDEDATLELRVKTVKYFKGLMHVHNRLVDPVLSINDQ
uniref:Glucosamine-6-phosphate deaminase 2 n=1 Tax=Salmo trutta TaxID=8032 RepID=A0A674BNV3_SALTR